MLDLDILAEEMLAKRIAGEIVLSDTPGETIKKWRSIFRIAQRALADEMKVMPSVVSDYENSRRKSPGIKVIRKIVTSMISIDQKNGGRVLKEFSEFPGKTALSDAVLGIKEFNGPVSVKDMCKSIGADLLVRDDLVDSKLYGYTVIDTVKAVTEMSPMDMTRLYGGTTERALIFVGTRTGKSTMAALKVTGLRPGLVILHGSSGIDETARRIAQVEGIPVAIIKDGNRNKLLADLKKVYSKK